MSRVTNRIGIEALRDLLERTRVGVLAHVDASGAVQAFPVSFRWHEGRFHVGLPNGALQSGTHVALAVDDGWFWWELRAVLVRGVLTPSERLEGPATSQIAWFELSADRVTAWDYGTLREES